MLNLVVKLNFIKSYVLLFILWTTSVGENCVVYWSSIDVRIQKVWLSRSGYWQQRADERLDNPPRRYPDKVENPPDELGWASLWNDIFTIQCPDTVGWV